MTEENETVHQIDLEMQKLIKIISNDKKLIEEKDLVITKLRKQIENQNLKEILEEKDIEDFQNEKQDELIDVKLELEHFKYLYSESETERESLNKNLKNQMELSETHRVLQSKMAELMNIIEEQNIQIKNLNGKEKNQEMISERNEVLQRELHVLKIMLQQKDLDIKSLNQLLDGKEELIKENENNLKLRTSEVNLLFYFKFHIIPKNFHVKHHLSGLKYNLSIGIPA